MTDCTTPARLQAMKSPAKTIAVRAKDRWEVLPDGRGVGMNNTVVDDGCGCGYTYGTRSCGKGKGHGKGLGKGNTASGVDSPLGKGKGSTVDIDTTRPHPHGEQQRGVVS